MDQRSPPVSGMKNGLMGNANIENDRMRIWNKNVLALSPTIYPLFNDAGRNGIIGEVDYAELCNRKWENEL